MSVIFNVIYFSVWIIIGGFMIYNRLKKPSKTWRDYADTGLIVLFLGFSSFFVFLTLIR